MGQPQSSIKISSAQHAELLELSKKTGHKMWFHIERAIRNYLTDEAPQWIKAAERIVKK